MCDPIGNSTVPDGVPSLSALGNAVDPITGYQVRDCGSRVARRLLEEANAGNTALVAFWLDIDRFRQINDSFGHAGGDRVIGNIAARIRVAVIHPGEFIRMGGDEFVVLIPALDHARAEQLAREFLLSVEQTMPIDGLLIRPTVSIGIALAQPGEDPSGFLERAERAMIDASRHGGNRYVLSGQEAVSSSLGSELAREELLIETVLHDALNHGGLQLHYQPVVRPDGSILAVEALLRCTANGIEILPDKFIPVAEKSGLISRIGEWSLMQGARCAARLHAGGYASKVAINVSRIQLISPSFLATVHAALLCARIPADLIELEVTESLIMDPSPIVQANLHLAREAGVGLAGPPHSNIITV